MMHMPVGGKDGKRPARPVRQFQETIIRQNREVKHHLIHLCITVSPDTEQIILHQIQHADHFLRRITFRQVVPRSVVEDIPQQGADIALSLSYASSICRQYRADPCISDAIISLICYKSCLSRIF